MAPIPPSGFRRALASLDGPAFAAFVATLWQESGWTTDRRDQLVVATRGEERRRLLVLPPRRLARFRRAPTADQPIDAAVTAQVSGSTTSLPRGTPDVPVVDADALRERALYALSEDACSAVFEEYLDVPPRGARWRRSTDASARQWTIPVVDVRVPLTAPILPVGADRPVPERTVLVVLVVGLVLALGLVAAVALPGSGLAGFADGGDSSDRSGQESVDGDAASASNGAEPATDSTDDGPSPESVEDDPDDPDDPTGVTDDSAEEPVAEFDSSVYDVQQTCERSAAEVADVLSAAFQEGQSGRALRVYWDFSNPDHRQQTSYSAFVAILRDAFEELVDADRIVHDDPESTGDGRVTIEATVHDNGSESTYEYRLQQWDEEPVPGCWVVDSLEPV